MMSQPHFGQVWGWSPTLGKVRGGILRDSWMFRARHQGPKQLALECSWCHWKGLETYISKMALHWPFRHLQPKLWAKERPWVKLAIWLPTSKSRESTSSWRCLEECDTALESSQRELQLWFRTCPDPSSGRGVMAIQSSGSPAGTLSGLHFGWRAPKSWGEIHLKVSQSQVAESWTW
jgi:hypothetical protein